MANAKLTLLSFGIMVILWGLLFGSFAFSFVFMVLLCLHETGHYAVAQLLGMKVTMPIFTPMGALIAMKKMPQTAIDEALMAYAGPFMGTTAALAAFALGNLLASHEIILAAKFGFALNLFNLIPISPLDGGRVLMVVDRRFWIVGLAMVGCVVYSFRPDGMTILVLTFLALFAYRDVKMRQAQAITSPSYFEAGSTAKWAFAAAYIALVMFLLVMLRLS